MAQCPWLVSFVEPSTLGTANKNTRSLTGQLSVASQIAFPKGGQSLVSRCRSRRRTMPAGHWLFPRLAGVVGLLEKSRAEVVLERH